MVGPLLRPAWWVELQDGDISLRPIRRRDRREWEQLRASNRDWLEPWEATSPNPGTALDFGAYVADLHRQARAGTALPLLVFYRGQMVGQLTIFSITYGSAMSATLGYWIAREFAGRGIIPTAVCLATDYCFKQLGLHRMEINLRPENVASKRVVEKLGFRYEGLRRQYLHIAGAWADHLSYALTSDEVPAGILARWRGQNVG